MTLLRNIFRSLICQGENPVPIDVHDTIAIYFGSKTGTAYSYARQLESEGEDKNFSVRVFDLDQFEKNYMLRSCRTVSVFLVATTGSGNPTENSAAFMKWLKRKKRKLRSMRYAVFGLGDSDYISYNAVGKSLNFMLEQSGASRIFEYGEGDASKDQEAQFVEWKKGLWKVLGEILTPMERNGVHAGNRYSHESDSIPFDVKFFNAPKDQSLTMYTKPPFLLSSSHHFMQCEDVVVNKIEQLSKDETLCSVFHIELEHFDKQEYATAGNISIVPSNDPSLVEQIANRMGFDLQTIFELKPKEDAVHLPFVTPCSIQKAMTDYLDISSFPTRNFLEKIAEYCTDPSDKQKILRLISEKGTDGYKTFVHRAYGSIADILLNIVSLDLPWRDFVHLVPVIQPRTFTISSSSRKEPISIHLTASVTRDEKQPHNLTTAGDGQFMGLCSGYFKRLKDELQISDRVTLKAFRESSKFSVPTSNATPVIMIASGAGIAPMRAILQERKYRQDLKEERSGKNALFYGFRRINGDFLYGNELRDYVNESFLDLHVAFSREQREKVYVQHVLARQRNAIRKLVFDQGAVIYICGKTAMGRDVRNALVEILGDKYQSGGDVLRKLYQSSRFFEEVWG